MHDTFVRKECRRVLVLRVNVGNKTALFNYSATDSLGMRYSCQKMTFSRDFSAIHPSNGGAVNPPNSVCLCDTV